MSEYTDLYKEIVETQRHCKSEKITKDSADRDMKFFKLRASVLHDQTAIAIHGYPNGGKSFMNHMDRARITSPGESIPLLPPKVEFEQLICENGGGQITRGECLEKEGHKETEHKECKGCELGIINKKVMCPPEQEHI